MRDLPAPWVAGTVMVNGAVPTDEAIVYVGGDADTGPEVEIVIRGLDALRISGLIAATPDMLAALKVASDALAGTLKARGYVPGSSIEGWAPEVQVELRSLVAIRAVIRKAEG